MRAPRWSAHNWQYAWQHWQEDWWRGQTRLDLYRAIADRRPTLPASFYARVRQVVESGSEIEDLDI